ncbi:DUF222 domain-containing protein [Georgenia sp. 311]|uniref:HNH endonuclease signature motif containing protein n=1 Tax=Georgenia sp. 311 TaxID=2585134 RepID=UPI0011126B2E|nr:HNH endonuclease signature motif containing protein [Georgenia sp. 311]TNC18095.1 DUF222 domain-containing protein [Georgenia sp. 311]
MVTTTPLGPRPLADQVRVSVAALRAGAPGEGAGGWTGEEREAVVAELDAAIRDLTVYRGQVLLAHRQDGRWGTVTDRDFADYRSRSTGIGRGAAVGDLQLAEGLEAMPAVAGAVESGDLTLEHARTLTRLQRGASPAVRGALTEGGLDGLLERAARERLSAPDLGRAAKAWAATVDAAAAQAEFESVRRRRTLTLRRQAGGVAGEFFLDPVAGEELRIALEAVAGRPAAAEERTREQRMADALTTMAGRVLQVGADRAGAQVQPHLALLVSEQTWVGIRRRRRAAHPTGPTTPWPDVPAGQLEDGTPVPVGELERLMCDCETTRAVMSAAGVPLDVGRTQRHHTKELRRAVLTRDRHCQWPACRQRASWCEVHHLTWWSRGGTTTLLDGITLCSYHHHRVHETDAVITPLADGFDFHHRSGAHIGTTRRGDGGVLAPDPEAARQAVAAVREGDPRPGGAEPAGGRGDSCVRTRGGWDPGAAERTSGRGASPPLVSSGSPPSVAGSARRPGVAGTAQLPVRVADKTGRPPRTADTAQRPARAAGTTQHTARTAGTTQRPARAADTAQHTGDVLARPPPPGPTEKSRRTATAGRGAPEPSHPSSYAAAPTLWGPDPPF